MLILIISAVFPPEPVVSAQTSIEIARELLIRGHIVSVITSFPSRPEGRLYPGFKRKLFERTYHKDGYEIIRCFSFTSLKSTLISRFFENISIGITASLALLFMNRVDVIYCNMWPIFASGIVRLVALIKKTPVIFSIQDIYPESLIYQGRVKSNSLLVRLFRCVDGAIARSSDGIVVLSEKHAQIYRRNRKVKTQKVHVVPNWISNIPQIANSSGSVVRQRYKIPEDDFLLVYGGNISYSAGVETIIEAFRYIQDGNIHLLIAGSGSRLDECRSLASKIRENQIHFYTPWPVEDTDIVYSAADVLILPTRGAQAFASVPSKLIAYMLSQKPIISLSRSGSDLSNLILESGSGWNFESDNPEELADEIVKISCMDKGVLTDLGKNGREYATRNMTAQVCLPKIIQILEILQLSKKY